MKTAQSVISKLKLNGKLYSYAFLCIEAFLIATIIVIPAGLEIKRFVGDLFTFPLSHELMHALEFWQQGIPSTISMVTGDPLAVACCRPIYVYTTQYDQFWLDFGFKGLARISWYNPGMHMWISVIPGGWKTLVAPFEDMKIVLLFWGVIVWGFFGLTVAIRKSLKKLRIIKKISGSIDITKVLLFFAFSLATLMTLFLFSILQYVEWGKLIEVQGNLIYSYLHGIFVIPLP